MLITVTPTFHFLVYIDNFKIVIVVGDYGSTGSCLNSWEFVFYVIMGSYGQLCLIGPAYFS